jgi:hypothetical protein
MADQLNINPFRILNVDSSFEDVKTYLETLRASDYSYHLDDDLDDVLWTTPPPNEVLLTMKVNATVLWRIHELRIIDWSGIWKIYNP